MTKQPIYSSAIFLALAMSVFISSRLIAKPLFQLDLGRLWLTRVGEDANSYMRTTNVLTPVLAPKSSFLIKDGSVSSSPVSADRQLMTVGITPPRAKFNGEWRGKNEGSSVGSVLGGIEKLIMDETIINIPVVMASNENLLYYGAYMIKDGEIMDVESPVPLIIAGVTVGETYIRGFIMSRKYGGGEYLEYHDTPHFHMPLDQEAGGVLILGKREGDDYYVTAYKIPYGYGIYTPPNVLHADAHLVGRYLVMYTYTENFSTVNLKTRTNDLVEVQFFPQYDLRTEHTEPLLRPKTMTE